MPVTADSPSQTTTERGSWRSPPTFPNQTCHTKIKKDSGMAIRLPDGYEPYLYWARWRLPGLGTSRRSLQVRCRFKESLRFTCCWTFISANCLRLCSESLESVNRSFADACCLNFQDLTTLLVPAIKWTVYPITPPSVSKEGIRPYASGWRVRYSNSIKGKIFVSSPRRPGRLGGPTNPSLTWCRDSFPGVNPPGLVVYLEPKLRMSGAHPLLPSTPSRYGLHNVTSYHI
jgi:hypothetical protein